MLLVGGEIKAWAMDYNSIMKEYEWWRRYSDESMMYVAKTVYAGGELLG